MSTAAPAPPAEPGVSGEDVKTSGTVIILAGAISVAAGLLAILFPDISLLALAIFAGINLLVLGGLSVWDALGANEDVGARVLSAVVGIVGLIAGIVVLRRPDESLLALVVILGAWLIVFGFVDVVRAVFVLRDRSLRLLRGVVDILLGIIILSVPELSLKTLAVFVGIAFVVRGVIAVALGVRLRRAAA